MALHAHAVNRTTVELKFEKVYFSDLELCC